MAKKKKIVTTRQEGDKSQKKKVVPTVSKKAELKSTTSSSRELVFGSQNYMWVLIGIGLIALGMILMMGGFNENPTVWDEGLIYSPRRILIAPIVILAGLGVQIYAIFK